MSTNLTIEIDGDLLVPDEQQARDWHTTRRTLGRYDRLPDGLPFVIVGGKKFRPQKRCREWLAKRIQHPNPRRKA